MSSNATDSEVLRYTGEGGEGAPQNVVRLRVDLPQLISTVT